ncbi:helix-turn-helix transcriptional regulator [Sphingomonas sp. MMS12-HWE2-04]|uniref:helix-turn-helix transcriptional regulator n=1 Tax=Sphingomonas sp. MMS12-HWE2-04 TaxID=3234199 RepID=UPI00384BD5AE
MIADTCAAAGRAARLQPARAIAAVRARGRHASPRRERAKDGKISIIELPFVVQGGGLSPPRRCGTTAFRAATPDEAVDGAPHIDRCLHPAAALGWSTLSVWVGGCEIVVHLAAGTLGAGHALHPDDLPLAWETLDHLIGEIYECALDPSRWNATIEEIRLALCPPDWRTAFLMLERRDPPSARFIATTNVGPGVESTYSAVFAYSNPWSRRTWPARNGQLIDTDDILPREELRKTGLYKNFLAAMNVDRTLCLMLDRSDGARLGLLLIGPGDRNLTVLRRGLRVLGPHIQRAVRISQRIASAEVTASAAQAAANRSRYALISLDKQLNILSANERVAHYEATGLITTAGGKLAFVDPAAQRKLAAMGLSASGDLAFQAIDRAGRERPVLGVLIKPKTIPMIGGAIADAAMIITIGSGVGEGPVLGIDRLAQWFGLTPTEARVVGALVNGQSPQEYAAHNGVSVNAVRFHLKHIFLKTETASQAQLVARIAQMPQ